MDILNYYIPKSTKIVVSYHSDPISTNLFFNFFYTLLSFFFLKSVDVIIVSSEEYMKGSFLLNLFKKKTKIVPIGVEEHSIKKNKNFKYNNFILFLGANRRYKGIKYLVRAADLIHGKIIISGNGDFSEFKKYKKKILFFCKISAKI